MSSGPLHHLTKGTGKADNWTDVKYRYYSDTGTLSLYFRKATPGLIDHSEVVWPGLVADYTANEQLVSVDISCAAAKIKCHFYDTISVINGLPALELSCQYDQAANSLSVVFTASRDVEHLQQTEDNHLWLGLGGARQWQGMVLRGASSFISR